MEEKWKDIQGYNGDYQVSNKGRVRSFHKKGVGKKKRDTPRLMKPTYNKVGYDRSNFTRNGVYKRIFVHRLVAKAFIPNPENKPYINHKDGDKSNNHVDNLEWCTRQENYTHASKNGLMARGENSGVSKLTRQEVIEIRRKYKTNKYSQRELAKIYNVSIFPINEIVNNKSWRHIK